MPDPEGGDRVAILDTHGVHQRDDWLVGRRYLSEGSMALVLGRGPEADAEPASLPAQAA